MALQISIYNKQDQTSKSGKKYIGRVCVFSPGQSGRLSDADQLPPFYIRDQRGDKQWVRLEARTIAEAKVEAAKAQDIIEAAAKGLPIITSGRVANRLAERIDAYLDEVEANKSIGTWDAYRRSLELFKESCHRLNVEDVTRKDMLDFKVYLRKDMKERSAYNNFLNTMIFLAWCKHKVEIKKADWPLKTEREAEEYHDDEIEAMMKAADADGRLLLKAFLSSGLRDGEMARLTYGDIEPRSSLWTVRPKNGHKLKTEKSQRVVPVGEWLTKKLMEKKKKESKTDNDLIFPNSQGKPDEHLIRVVKRAAKNAGVTGRVDNHKFRSTAITLWLRNGCTVPEVMSYVGHTNPETILRYAAKVNLQKKENRDRITQPFERFGAMGD